MSVLTAATPGPVGVLQLMGHGALDVLERISGVTDWLPSHLRLVQFGDLDEGLAVVLRSEWVQLMPHGGPRVIHHLVERLIELGAVCETGAPALEQYPEAESGLEADMLATLARAESPAAIDLLIAQRERWREWNMRPRRSRVAPQQILNRSDSLDRLVDPPSVVVVGRPNVGKSTLSNQILGRTASIVADLPGTTRDWVGGLAEIRAMPQLDASVSCGIAVRWFDTPGLRESSDQIEQQAIELAQEVMAAADVLVAMRDPQIDWSLPQALPRSPDLWLMNKIDRVKGRWYEGGGQAREAPLAISAVDGRGIAELQEAVLSHLQLHRLVAGELWAFSSTLREALRSHAMVDLTDYLMAPVRDD